ncbi:MAG: hypothetical protein KBD01_00055 [Acidobacteria bacterium]|nr:hypothetical protein [Acidobacteriota bacterium]
MAAGFPWHLPLAAIGPEPYLLPEVLALCGLLAALMAAARRRLDGRGSQVLRRAHVGLAALAFCAAGITFLQNATLFWNASWRDEGRVLLLERMAPLQPVRLARHDIASITEFATTERGWSGRRGAVRFLVTTRDHREFWSGPIYHRNEARFARETLIAATGRRLARFTIGRVELD